MDLSNIIVYAVLGFICVSSYMVSTANKKLEDRVKKLDQKLKEIDTIKTGSQNNIFTTTSCAELQLYNLEKRAN